MSASTQTARALTKVARFIPILSWLPHYDRSWLSGDVIAGLTLWGLVVPEGMAYAGLARLGFITQFLSKPVMSGFVVGEAFP